MPDISAYSQPYVGQNQTADYNFDLISKVMQNKQSEFDASLRNLQNLKSQSLNIRFINNERQKQVDDYNKQLTDKFSNLNGEYGDLSEAKNYNNYLNWFDNIAKDTDLITAYHVDKQWQNETSKKDAMKMAKDPAKAGYGVTNEQNFNDDLNNYKNSTKNNPVDFQPYVPFVDPIKQRTEFLKSVPKQEWETDEVMGNGYTRVTKMSGYSEDQIRMLNESMGLAGRSQTNVDARWLFNRNNKINPEQFRQSVATQWETREKNLKTDYQNKLSDNDVKISREQDIDKLTQLQQYKQVLQSKIQGIDQEIVSPDGWKNMKDSDLLARFSDLHNTSVNNAISKGLASKESHIIKKDDTFLANQNYVQRGKMFTERMKFEAAKENNHVKHDEADIALKGMAIMQKGMVQSSKGLDANGNLLSRFGLPDLQPTLDQQGNISTDVKKDEYRQIVDVQNQNSAKAFNIIDDNEWKTKTGSDGKPYTPTLTWRGAPRTNNDVLKDFVTASSDMSSWNQFSNVLDNDPVLPHNGSVQLLRGIMPKLLSDPKYQTLTNPDDKLKYVKQEVSELQNLTPEMAAKYGESGVALSNMYNSTKQFEKTYNDKLGVATNQALKDLGYGNMSWDDAGKQHPKEVEAARLKVANLMMKSQGTAILLGNQYFNFEPRPDKIPASGKMSPENEAYLKFRTEIARGLKEQYQLKGDIPLGLINSATMDGEGSIKIGWSSDINKYESLSPDVKDLMNKKEGIYFFRTPASTILNMPSAAKKPNEIDKTITAGGISTTSVFRGNKLYKIELSQAGDERSYHYTINGISQPIIQNNSNLFPREILQTIIEQRLR